MRLNNILTVLALIASASVVHAQGGTVTSGCGDSPENPTVILALVGSSAAGISVLRNRLRLRHRK
jgi:XrtJ-associated TM-motif-TM protein